MKNLLKTLSVAVIGLSMSLGSISASMASPISLSTSQPLSQNSSPLELVRDHRGDRRKHHNSRRPGNHTKPWYGNSNRPHHGRPGYNNHHRPNYGRPGYNNRPGYWNGHNGYRHERPGYRRHSDGWWYPVAAFAGAAAVLGIIANQNNNNPPPRAQTMNQNHINWCHNRWKSYRASDNTYQPLQGPRAYCVSPY